MKSIGKLGDKIKSRLSDNRKIANILKEFTLKNKMPQKSNIFCNIKNTFITNDIYLLEEMGYKVFLIYSPAYKDPFRFF